MIAATVLAAALAVAPAQQVQQPQQYATVRPGDTLSELVGSDWRWACVANVAEGRVGSCDLIYPDQVVRVTVPVAERWHIVEWFARQEPPQAPVRRSEPPPAPETHQAPARPSAAPVGPSGGWSIPESIVMCESGGDYRAENPSSSASGAYQIIDSTWGGYAGYGHASDAPPHIQDQRAAQIWDGGRGRGNWVC